MTEKELRRLKRHEVLQLLLAQVHEDERLQTELTEAQDQVQELEGTLEHLKERLDEKDAQIERLKGRLDVKDERIRRLRELTERYQKSRRIELNEAGNIAEAALRLNHIFEAAQKTAEQYLYNVRLLCGGEPDADELDESLLNHYLIEIDREEAAEADIPAKEQEAAEADVPAKEQETAEADVPADAAEIYEEVSPEEGEAQEAGETGSPADGEGSNE